MGSDRFEAAARKANRKADRRSRVNRKHDVDEALFQMREDENANFQELVEMDFEDDLVGVYDDGFGEDARLEKNMEIEHDSGEGNYLGDFDDFEFDFHKRYGDTDEDRLMDETFTMGY